uniref:Aquaporin-4 n=1 Tax=Oreochromis aureus TaxID=47969 RepID=A0A668VZZ5_OREAU
MRWPEFWRCVTAEFSAMLIFVLLGLGSTINWGTVKEDPHPPDLVLISLCFGLTIATMVQCFGHISGAHINPAVTVAMVVTRKLSLAKAVFYLLAQCVGAIVGAAVLYGITPASVRGGMGVNESISVGTALVVELFITFQLIFTIFATCDHKRKDLKGSSALAIGLSVCVGHLFAIPYTGASMNPARSFGPAMVTWSWENHWFWILVGCYRMGAPFDPTILKVPNHFSQHFSEIIRTQLMCGNGYSHKFNKNVQLPSALWSYVGSFRSLTKSLVHNALFL